LSYTFTCRLPVTWWPLPAGNLFPDALTKAQQDHILKIFNEFKKEFAKRFRLLMDGQRCKPDEAFFVPWLIHFASTLVHYKRLNPDHGYEYSHEDLRTQIQRHLAIFHPPLVIPFEQKTRTMDKISQQKYDSVLIHSTFD
jgi:hypothetical protein